MDDKRVIVMRHRRSGTWRLAVLLMVSVMEASILMVTGSSADDAIQVTKDGGRTHVACLDTGKKTTLRFADPYDTSWFEDPEFVALDWKWRNASGNDKTKERSFMTYYRREGDKMTYPAERRISTYQFWGFQISGLRHGDTGLFMAKYFTITPAKSLFYEINVIVASPPTLKSDALKMEVEEAEGGKTRVTCGQLASLGKPPVDLVLKAGDGTVLHTDNAQGSIVLTLDKAIADVGELQCGIKASSPARQCIPPTDSTRFDDVIYGDADVEAATDDAAAVTVLFSEQALLLFASGIQYLLTASFF